MKKVEQYDISDGKITRKRQFCPEDSCGAGVFLADHKDRLSCGKCGYTKFKSDNQLIQLVIDSRNIKTNISAPSATMN